MKTRGVGVPKKTVWHSAKSVLNALFTCAAAVTGEAKKKRRTCEYVGRLLNVQRAAPSSEKKKVSLTCCREIRLRLP